MDTHRTSEVGWVKEWISQSQDCPLDIYLDFCFDYSEDDKAGAKQILDYVLKAGHKIRLLMLFGLPSLSPTLFGRLTLRACPSLTLLEGIYLQKAPARIRHTLTN